MGGRAGSIQIFKASKDARRRETVCIADKVWFSLGL
jgi:hypothetical protein